MKERRQTRRAAIARAPLLGRALLLIAGFAIGLSLVEATLRAFYATRVGPRILFYGTSLHRNVLSEETESALESRLPVDRPIEDRTVRVHGRKLRGYQKYFPNELKFDRDPDTGERFPVRINRHGFRGSDFAIPKRRGTVRLVTLGSSSTFGYYNRDDATYPVQLSGELAARCPEQTFEVINLAIPHLTSAQILALFRREGLRLKPDIVTFYEGRNDSMLLGSGLTGDDDEDLPLVARWLVLGRLVHSWSDSRSSAFEVSEQLAGLIRSRRDHFVSNLAAIADLAESRGMLFVPITQQGTAAPALAMSKESRKVLKGIRFEDERNAILARAAAREPLTGFESSFLIHAELQDAVRAFAEQRDLPLVDFISHLDPDRDLLLSWVHLHPDANRRLASSIADVIEPRLCQTALRE